MRIVRMVLVACLATAGVTLPMTGVAASAPPGCGAGTDRTIDVSTKRELLAAIANARPGDAIRLAPGEYTGAFVISRSGTAAKRISLCGPREATLRYGTVLKGFVIRLEASYWDLVGFTVTLGQKGVRVAGGHYNVLSDLEVHKVGNEAVHFGYGSTHNLVTGSAIHDTGLRDSRFGEGVYVGTAESNRCFLGHCRADASDWNSVVGNRFGRISAEAVDVKEGTRFGLVASNVFDGTRSLAHAWVDVKGNDWVVRDNVGHVSRRDGFLTETVRPGWGTRNLFVANRAEVDGKGYGFNVTSGNVVACDNQVMGAARGFASVSCTPFDG